MITKNTSLKQVLEIQQGCKKCSNCCKYSSGFLMNDDMKKIADFLKITVEELKKEWLETTEQFNKTLFRPRLVKNKKPYGACIFLNTGQGCKIHDVKPLQCKIGACNEHGEPLTIWFMLNYIIDPNDPEAIRQYASYLKTGGKTIPGGRLEELVPDKERLNKILEYKILK